MVGPAARCGERWEKNIQVVTGLDQGQGVHAAVVRAAGELAMGCDGVDGWDARDSGSWSFLGAFGFGVV